MSQSHPVKVGKTPHSRTHHQNQQQQSNSSSGSASRLPQSQQKTAKLPFSTSGLPQKHQNVSSTILKVLPPSSLPQPSESPQQVTLTMSQQTQPLQSPRALPLQHQLPQFRSRPSSIKRNSLKSTIVTSVVPHDTQPSLQAASQPVHLQGASTTPGVIVARHLPNKISNSVQALHTQSTTKQQLVSNEPSAFGGGLEARLLVKKDSYEEVAAYIDSFQNVSNQSLATQLRVTSHHSRTQANSAQNSGASAGLSIQKPGTLGVMSIQKQQSSKPLSPVSVNHLHLKQKTTGTLAPMENRSLATNETGGLVPGKNPSVTTISKDSQNGQSETIEEGAAYSIKQDNGTTIQNYSELFTVTESQRDAGKTEPQISVSQVGALQQQQQQRRNADSKVTKTSERYNISAMQPHSAEPDHHQSIQNQAKMTQSETPTANQPESKQLLKNTCSPSIPKSNPTATIDAKDEFSLTARACEDSILDFVDSNRNIFGQIDVFKINFSKNLRRFQELALEQAQAEPKLTAVANRLLSETILPSTWSVSSHEQKRGGPRNVADAHQVALSLDRTDQRSELATASPMYTLNSGTLPLVINFNPLMITFCLFLRQVAEIARTDESLEGAENVAAMCLVKRKKIVSKLYQLSIKAVNHALQSLDMEGVTNDQLPPKVIEFIKKWVAKEKGLIAHCVKQMLFPAASGPQDASVSPTALTLDEDLKVRLAQELAAKKNKEKLESLVLTGGRSTIDGKIQKFNILNSQKLQDNQQEQRKKGQGFEVQRRTQDHFFQERSVENCDELPRNPSQQEKLLQPTKSLQSKVNAHHRETQNRNLQAEYHQMGAQKQKIFREPQMALSSTNFNKSEQHSLIQPKISQQHPSGIQGRSGLVNDVYGDWKHYNHSVSVHHPVVGLKKTQSMAEKQGRSEQESKREQHDGSVKRSFSPTQFEPNSSSFKQQGYDRAKQRRNEDLDSSDAKIYQQFPASQHQLQPGHGGQRQVLGGAQTVTCGFFNPHKHHQSSTNNLRMINQDLGFQNLSNFQWPRNTTNSSELLASGQVQGGSLARLQTRDSCYDNQGSQG